MQEKDHRKTLINKMNIPKSVADTLHKIDDKWSLTIANIMLNGLVIDKKYKSHKDLTEKDIRDALDEIWVIRFYDKIKDWLKGRADNPNPSEPSNLNLKMLEPSEAIKYSRDWHKYLKQNAKAIQNKQEQDKAIILYKDGSYWIDLETKNSCEEAGAMGHCGRTSAETIISYRDNKGQPHLTLAFNYRDKSYQQLKGKGNTKPHPKYFDKCYDIFKKLDISSYQPEYLKTQDFVVTDLPERQYEELVKRHPDLENDKEPYEKILELMEQNEWDNPQVMEWLDIDSSGTTTIELTADDFTGDQQHLIQQHLLSEDYTWDEMYFDSETPSWSEAIDWFDLALIDDIIGKSLPRWSEVKSLISEGDLQLSELDDVYGDEFRSGLTMDLSEIDSRVRGDLDFKEFKDNILDSISEIGELVNEDSFYSDGYFSVEVSVDNYYEALYSHLEYYREMFSASDVISDTIDNLDSGYIRDNYMGSKDFEKYANEYSDFYYLNEMDQDELRESVDAFFEER